MPRVVMTGSHKGSPDGSHSYLYEDGVEYGLPESLARVFLENGMAEIVPEDGSGDPEPEDGVQSPKPKGRKPKGGS